MKMREYLGIAPAYRGSNCSKSQAPGPMISLLPVRDRSCIDPNKEFERSNTFEGLMPFYWNIISGCTNGCPYCRVKDFTIEKEGTWAPKFHPGRLNAPYGSRPIFGHRAWRIYVAALGDFFCDGVPDEWISATMDVIRDTPRWWYFFCTKCPKRASEIGYPDNTAVATSIDTVARLKIAEEYMPQVNSPFRIAACSPLLERLVFKGPAIFDGFMIFPREPSGSFPVFWPPLDWVESIIDQAESVGALLWVKSDLIRHYGLDAKKTKLQSLIHATDAELRSHIAKKRRTS
ncbi:MAG: DUF5131 family protein [Acidobacteria bacterium]|nr:DUF5131 family protein [Acidobacteriota bacterium]